MVLGCIHLGCTPTPTPSLRALYYKIDVIADKIQVDVAMDAPESDTAQHNHVPLTCRRVDDAVESQKQTTTRTSRNIADKCHSTCSSAV